MTTIQGILDNLDSEDNHLEHFGKKGMRWGVRGSRSGGNKPAKPLSKSQVRTKQIKEARLKQFYKEMGVYRGVAKTVTGKKGTRGKEAMKTYDKAVDLVTGKNAKVAIKMTRGEVIGNGLLLGGIGAVYIAALGAAK